MKKKSFFNGITVNFNNLVSCIQSFIEGIPFLNKLFSLMKKFGKFIEFIVISLLLSVAYFIGIGVIAVFSKLFRKHFIDISPIDKSKSSYWKKRSPISGKIDDYYRAF